MAERALIQYQPITGPVWSEPVASRLAWLPSVQQPARGLPPNRLGDFVQPPFDALYKPEGLQWQPRGKHEPLPPEFRKLGDFQQPAFDALYKPAGVQWLPSDRYAGRSLPRGAYDYSVSTLLIIAAAYDPRTLEWLTRSVYPQVPVERRLLGDFQQPSFAALYKPEGLQWFPAERYFGRSLARALNDWSVLVQLVAAAAYDPQNLEWQPRDRYFGIPLARALVDWSVYQGDPIAAVAPVIIAPSPSTIGGIGRWTTQFPRPPEKPAQIVFKRNMENADRQDIEDIVRILNALLEAKK